MARKIDVKFYLCDHLNPDCGYRLWIGDSQTGETLLFTSRHMVTGTDLLTAQDCLEVAAMYAEPND